MKEENVKTAILTVLVLLSLVLTGILWYGSPSYEETDLVFQESIFFEEPRDETAIIAPSQILIPMSDNEYIICSKGTDDYRKIWEKTLLLINNSSYAEDPPETLQTPEKPSLKMYFEPAYPLGMLDGTGGTAINMTKLQLYFYAESLLVEFEGGGRMYATFSREQVDTIKEYINGFIKKDNNIYEIFRFKEEDFPEETPLLIEKDIYLPSDNVFLYSYVVLKREQIILEDLLRVVFVNIKLARKIEEPGGTQIFTDGEKGLRISNYVEYTAPRLEKGTVTHSYCSAVQKANEYICYYGGWPGELYLDDIFLHDPGNQNNGGKSYFAVWRYYFNGFPVVGKDAVTELKYNDQDLFYYKRNLYKPVESSGEKIQAGKPEDVIRRAFEIFVEKDKNNEHFLLNDIYLAYLTEEYSEKGRERAYPVWVIKINNEEVYFNAVDLTPLERRAGNEYSQG